MYDYMILSKLYLFHIDLEFNPMEEEMCLMDSCTTNSILRETKYFQTLTKRTGNILTIAGRDAMIVGSGKATITLFMGTQITIENALLYPDSTRTLISYRDICKNGLHVVTHEENNKEFLLITKDNGYGHDILERIPSLPSGLYYYIHKTRTTCCLLGDFSEC